MIAEMNYVQKWFKDKYPNGNVPDGVYAIPAPTSKGDAFMKMELKNESSFGENNFNLYWDEELTISWYTNDKPENFMTLLQFVNMFFFQFFFVRLTKYIKQDINGDVIITHWTFMYWVIPFTGWNSKFKYIGKQAKFLYLK